jgi:outer membrane receptor protein involved in Fe transport
MNIRENKALSIAMSTVCSAAFFPAGMSLAADSEEPQTLETIIVTAQKREQEAIDVPASVTALSGQELSQDGLQRLEDYVAQVPGLSITANGGSMQVTLRGISTGLSQSAPTTSIYIDEAPVGSVNAYAVGAGLAPDLDPYDLSRIEVLKGPQGTLFGAGAMGGMLRYVTTGPDFEHLAGSITAGVDTVEDGGTGHLERVTLNLPFDNETMALRISAFDRHEAGYTDNILKGEKNVDTTETFGGRAVFAWKISSDWRIDLSGMTQRYHSIDGNGFDVNGETLQPTYGRYEFASALDTGDHTEYNLGNLAVHGKIGNFNLVSSTTFQIVDAFASGDGTDSYGVIATLLGNPGLAVETQLHEHTQRESEELRLDSTAFDDRLYYEGGLYFTHEDDENRIPSFPTYSLATGAPQPIVIPGTDVPFPGGFVQAKIDTTYKEASAFANATYSFSPQFDLQGGVRFGENWQTYDQYYSGLLFTPAVSLVQDGKTNNTNYLATFSYKPTQTNSIYVRVANGYRPGGPSAATPITGANPVVGPDKLTSVELGWKSVMDGGKLSFDTAVFHTDWKDIQIQTSADGDAFFVNGGTAVSQGAEAAAAYAPITGLTLRADIGYTDARLTENTNNALVAPGVPLGKDGDRLPFVPKISGSLGSEYRHPLFAGWTGSVGGSVNYVGNRKSDYSGNEGVDVPSYTTVHLNASIENSSWRVSAYVRNLTNSDGIIYLLNRGLFPQTPGVPYTAGVIRPRTLGVDLSYRF